jgi:pre-mRNA-processing factor 40
VALSVVSPAIATLPIGELETPAASVSAHQSALNGTDSTVGHHTGGLPFTPSSILPARPNLPDDPVIPHNGFATVEEGEKAFVHLLKKAGVDANWTWDQTMRAIITDPLYKALNTLGEKKAAWQKVRPASRLSPLDVDLFPVHRFTESKRARGERDQAVQVASRTS